MTTYTDWHPGQKVRQAHRAANEAHPPRPRYTPAPRPELVSTAQRSINHTAEQYRCPAGLNTYQSSRHWIPSTGTTCVRCGETADQILTQENH